MHDVLLRSSVEELDRLGVRCRSFRSRCCTNLPQCSTQGTTMGAILNRPGTALTHTFCGGSDTGHGHLRSWKVGSGSLREAEPENIDLGAFKVKHEAILT